VLIDVYKTPEKLPYSSLMVPVGEIKTIETIYLVLLKRDLIKDVLRYAMIFGIDRIKEKSPKIEDCEISECCCTNTKVCTHGCKFKVYEGCLSMMKLDFQPLEGLPPLGEYLTLYNSKILNKIKEKGYKEDMIQLHFVLVTYIKLLGKALQKLNSVKGVWWEGIHDKDDNLNAEENEVVRNKKRDTHLDALDHFSNGLKRRQFEFEA